MTNYSNCVIYKLFCKDYNITDCYIGSTTDFRHRSIKHKSDCNNTNSKSYNQYIYQFIREHKGWSNWKMTILEEFTCNNKFEKLQKEEITFNILNLH